MRCCSDSIWESSELNFPEADCVGASFLGLAAFSSAEDCALEECLPLLRRVSSTACFLATSAASLSALARISASRLSCSTRLFSCSIFSASDSMPDVAWVSMRTFLPPASASSALSPFWAAFAASRSASSFSTAALRSASSAAFCLSAFFFCFSSSLRSASASSSEFWRISDFMLSRTFSTSSSERTLACDLA